MPGGGKTSRCPDCSGSGLCEECYGTGVNLHINEAYPQCRARHATAQCVRCGGTGLLKRTTTLDVHIGFRLALSVIPVFILYKFLTERPVHFGRGGPIWPTVEWLSTFGVCGGVLYQFWKDVKRDDFKLRRNHKMTSLFGGSETRSTDESASGIEDNRA